MAEEEKKKEIEITPEGRTGTKEEVKEEKTAVKEKTAAKEKAAEELPALSKEAEKIIESVEKMTVLELHVLVKALEKKFGVSAQAVASATAPTGAGANAEEEKSTFTVLLKAAGEQKIQVIKAVKELLGLGLKEAKDMVDGAPSVLKEGVKKEEAEEMKAKIESAGGSIELR
jgi:large subunit ribosomal protein L7/L12